MYPKEYHELACNMQIVPKPVVKGSLVKRRRNWICCKQQYSTTFLVTGFFGAIAILIVMIGG